MIADTINRILRYLAYVVAILGIPVSIFIFLIEGDILVLVGVPWGIFVIFVAYNSEKIGEKIVSILFG